MRDGYPGDSGKELQKQGGESGEGAKRDCQLRPRLVSLEVRGSPAPSGSCALAP